MIVKEIIADKGIQYDYAYSDAGYKIERDGVQYADAVDPLGSGRVYTETDIPIEPIEQDEPSDEATEADYINALRELGVNTNEEENA